MASDEANASTKAPVDNTLTPASTVTLPEKIALSNTTTAYDPAVERTPRTSKESAARSNPFEADIEAMEVIDSKPCTTRSGGVKCTRPSDNQVWPGKDYWKQKAKSAKMKRGCTCLARMSRRNRVITKILIGILIVGIAVAVGFGVSKPLGAPIWGD